MTLRSWLTKQHKLKSVPHTKRNESKSRLIIAETKLPQPQKTAVTTERGYDRGSEKRSTTVVKEKEGEKSGSWQQQREGSYYCSYIMSKQNTQTHTHTQGTPLFILVLQ